MMESFIAEIANLLGVSQDIAQVLLQQYKWNKERLVDGYYSDPEKAVSNAGAGQAISNPQSAESTLICRICGDEHDLANVYGLNCGHRFCRYILFLHLSIYSCIHFPCFYILLTFLCSCISSMNYWTTGYVMARI